MPIPLYTHFTVFGFFGVQHAHAHSIAPHRSLPVWAKDFVEQKRASSSRRQRRVRVTRIRYFELIANSQPFVSIPFAHLASLARCLPFRIFRKWIWIVNAYAICHSARARSQQHCCVEMVKYGSYYERATSTGGVAPTQQKNNGRNVKIVV